MREGGCLGGQVGYRVTGPLRPIVACHCHQCRKSSNHHLAATSAARAHIQITGDVTWFQSSETSKRGFCGRCGSNLFWGGTEATLSILAGSLNTADGLSLVGHIYCWNKWRYYGIGDGLPQADTHNPSLTAMADDT